MAKSNGFKATWCSQQKHKWKGSPANFRALICRVKNKPLSELRIWAHKAVNEKFVKVLRPRCLLTGVRPNQLVRCQHTAYIFNALWSKKHSFQCLTHSWHRKLRLVRSSLLQTRICYKPQTVSGSGEVSAAKLPIYHACPTSLTSVSYRYGAKSQMHGRACEGAQRHLCTN